MVREGSLLRPPFWQGRVPAEPSAWPQPQRPRGTERAQDSPLRGRQPKGAARRAPLRRLARSAREGSGCPAARGQRKAAGCCVPGRHGEEVAALCDPFRDVCAAGVKTGRCLKDRDGVRGTCEILAWCPVERRSKPTYVAIPPCFQAGVAWLVCHAGQFLGSLLLESCRCRAGGSSAWSPGTTGPLPPCLAHWLSLRPLTSSSPAAWGRCPTGHVGRYGRKAGTNPSLPGNRCWPVRRTSLFTSRTLSASPSSSSPSKCRCSEIPLSSPSEPVTSACSALLALPRAGEGRQMLPLLGHGGGLWLQAVGNGAPVSL